MNRWIHLSKSSPLHSYLLGELGKDPVTSQPEIKILNSLRIFYMFLNN